MDFAILEKIATVLVAILSAWGVMRERVIKIELKAEQIQRDFEKLQENHEEHKDRVYEILKDISKQQQSILLILERNNVR